MRFRPLQSYFESPTTAPHTLFHLEFKATVALPPGRLARSDGCNSERNPASRRTPGSSRKVVIASLLQAIFRSVDKYKRYCRVFIKVKQLQTPSLQSTALLTSPLFSLQSLLRYKEGRASPGTLLPPAD